MDIRAKARTVLSVVEGQIPIASDKKPAIFTGYTGKDHKSQLIPYWKDARPPNILTTCNEFVNWYCRALNFRVILGAFETEKWLSDNDLHHAWVPSVAGGPEPKFGDILRHAEYHMDIAMDFDGRQLWRMASGQAGPHYVPGPGKGGLVLDEPSSHDLIDKVTSRDKFTHAMVPHNPAAYLGWIDLDLVAPQEQPVPRWIHGWWQVSFDDSGETYYYYFGDYKGNRVVHWQVSPPMSTGLRVFQPNEGNNGAFINEEPNGVSIKWNSGTHEEYTWDGGNLMNGPYNGGPDTLSAVKL